MSNEQRQLALERLRGLMKKSAKRKATTRKFEVVFSYPAWLVEEGDVSETAVSDPKIIIAADGLAADEELGEYLEEEEVIRTASFAGGNVRIRYDPKKQSILLDMVYRAAKNPGNRALKWMVDFNNAQLSDGWGEGIGLAVSTGGKTYSVRWEAADPEVTVRPLDAGKLEVEEKASRAKLTREIEQIDSRVDDTKSKIG